MTRRWLPTGLAILLMAGWLPAHSESIPAELIDARLELMREVAAAKWIAGVPIADPAREAALLAELADSALRYGLEPEGVVRLFEAQIHAARVIQSYWFASWESGREPPPATASSLGLDLRPRITTLGEQILVALAAQPATTDPRVFDQVVEVEGLPAADRVAILQALSALRRYPNRLAQVVESGRLRIGMTADYAPFSAAGTDDAPVGLDVDLAADLAAALGVRLEIVRTSWPSLMEDLLAGRYDIGMSGISLTEDRAQRAAFTRPYHADGKTPVARCADLARFASLEAIDQPGVRVIFNPGGTNERFVRERLTQATRMLHPDNRSIFEELVAGRADVMFTDRIEVELQTERHPELCAAMETNLTYQEKAYLLPRDAAWQGCVDTWLAARLADTSVDAAFRRHGVIRRPPRGEVQVLTPSSAGSLPHCQHSPN
ncbi:MAG: gamma subclass chorismate mutase AroQ [Steroidobacteraceae bacterium]